MMMMKRIFATKRPLSKGKISQKIQVAITNLRGQFPNWILHTTKSPNPICSVDLCLCILLMNCWMTNKIHPFDFFHPFWAGNQEGCAHLETKKKEEENLVAILSLPEGKISSIGKPTTNSRPENPISKISIPPKSPNALIVCPLIYFNIHSGSALGCQIIYLFFSKFTLAVRIIIIIIIIYDISAINKANFFSGFSNSECLT